jgi:uncharacterized membrane protein SpoIIM required for sporulation
VTPEPLASHSAHALRQVVTLPSAEFRKGREAAWRDLDALIARVEAKGVSALSAEELQRLPTLYRTAISSLSVARAIALDRNLILFLEALAVRAYFIVYGPRIGVGESLWTFLRRGFPAVVRANLGTIAFAFCAIVIGTILGFLLAKSSEEWVSLLMPEGLSGGRGPSSTAAELRDSEIFAPWPGFVASFVVFANILFQHNTAVAILSFALGVAGGAPTLALLLYQGLIFGAFAALHYNRGLLVDFLGWVSIHGVTEFGALILCGAGGLEIARTILVPGQYSRLDNLSRRGREAAGLAGGAVLMLLVAGLIEGGLRQLIANTPGRFAIAALTAALWFLYFARAGKEAANDARA